MAGMGKQRSVDAARFSMVPRNDVPRSAFDVSHGHKTTFNAKFLIPVYVDEVLPGDSVRLKMTAFCRLSTPIVPMMDNLFLESHFFYVPSRLLWEHWERFMGEQESPTDTTSFLLPYIDFPVLDIPPQSVGSIADYMGITNNGSGNVIRAQALPFRAYRLIWNEWFRDQDLQAKVSVDLSDGPDVTVNVLLPRGKRHDYFTSARPWPAKPLQMESITGALAGPQSLGGAAAGGSFYMQRTAQAGAPVSGIGWAGGPNTIAATAVRYPGVRDVTPAALTAQALLTAVDPIGYPDIRVLVNDIRTAELVQVMMERNARGGTRYAELVRSHFGVVSPDSRLQRPEYLGGGRTAISINPVAQTSASGSAGTTTVLGELAAIGSAVASGHGFSQSFTEHGIVLGLVSIRSDLTYQQGLERFWSRRTLFDIYWPGLANLPEQPILNQEIYSTGAAADKLVFGYQERWAEYKYKPSRTSGFFRSTVATPLDMWHLGFKFPSLPALNGLFVEDDPPIDRVLQVDTTFGEQFLFDSIFDVKMVRCMPMFSIPGLSGKL